MENRYFVEIAYDGRDYCGWQIQKNQPSIQETLQEKMSLQWNENIKIVGCGRTDSGVHAVGYFAHFNTSLDLTDDHLFKLNAFLPDSISLQRFIKVESDAHARFDALKRRYRYFLHFHKAVFRRNYSYFIPVKGNYKTDVFHELTYLLTQYERFKPFCKAGADVKHYKCKIDKMQWNTPDKGNSFIFTVEANRFLHGMIRLLVGCSLYVAAGRMTVDEVKKSMDDQKPLPMPFSAPAHGLFLDRVIYPDIRSSITTASIFPAFANEE